LRPRTVLYVLRLQLTDGVFSMPEHEKNVNENVESGRIAEREWRRDPANLAALLETEADGREVTVMGWVDARRDLGALIFLWLRDRYLQEYDADRHNAEIAAGSAPAARAIVPFERAVVQVTFNPETAPDAHRMAENLRGEYVVAVRGKWRMRTEKDVNKRFFGGDREIVATEVRILSPSETPPFYIAETPGASEDLRMQHRYLDLRRKPMVKAIATRHRIFLAMRNALDKLGFLEIETPVLGRSTPEGARDYLVPARNHPGMFYALPQSPQLIKQILMVSGFDRYFQMARCFRDEDLRANRQPEFTQLDLEMSFATRDELFEVGEKMFIEVFREVLDTEIDMVEYAPGKSGFPRMTYDEVMKRYGIDKPDLRFGCKIIDLCGVFGDSDFAVFNSTIANGGAVKAIFIPDYAPSRKEIDTLTEHARKLGAGGLAYAKVEGGIIAKTSFDKFLSEDERSAMAGIGDGNGIILIVAETPARKAEKVLGELRVKLGRELELAKKAGNENAWKFLWVVDFPLYERDEETGELAPAHHPFTMPHSEFMEEYEPGRFRLKATTDEDRLAIRSDNYDLVLNGEELGSGSLRINDPELQRSVLTGLGMGDDEIEERFGFFLDSFRYGAPPHRGFAFGMDRIVAMMLGLTSIRDVIAFPKTAQASDLMMKSPGRVSEEQLRELHLKTEL